MNLRMVLKWMTIMWKMLVPCFLGSFQFPNFSFVYNTCGAVRSGGASSSSSRSSGGGGGGGGSGRPRHIRWHFGFACLPPCCLSQFNNNNNNNRGSTGSSRVESLSSTKIITARIIIIMWLFMYLSIHLNIYTKAEAIYIFSLYAII